MASIFTRIIYGELPGRVVYADDRAVALLTIAPLRPGHVLVVPREEVDHWESLAGVLAAHLMAGRAAGRPGRARGFPAARVGLVVAGLEVPHTHLHVVPARHPRPTSTSARADPDPDPVALDAAATRIRAALGEAGTDHA